MHPQVVNHPKIKISREVEDLEFFINFFVDPFIEKVLVNEEMTYCSSLTIECLFRVSTVCTFFQENQFLNWGLAYCIFALNQV